MPLFAHSTQSNMGLPPLTYNNHTLPSSPLPVTETQQTPSLPTSAFTNPNKNDTKPSSTARFQRNRTVMACKNYVGTPMTREQAQIKLENCPQFKQTVMDSQGWGIFSTSLFSPSSLSSPSTASTLPSPATTSFSSSSWTPSFLSTQRQKTSLRTMNSSKKIIEGKSDVGVVGALPGVGFHNNDLVDRAIALEYGSRLRTCVLQKRKVKYATPY